MKEGTTNLSSCSWPVQQQVLKVVVCTAMVVVLVSIYQSCVSSESPWLAFRFVNSRPFFLVGTELSRPAQQRPSGNLQTAPAPYLTVGNKHSSASGAFPTTGSLSPIEGVKDGSNCMSEKSGSPNSVIAPSTEEADMNFDRDDSEISEALEDSSDSTDETEGTNSMNFDSNIAEKNESFASFGSPPILDLSENLKKLHPNSRKPELDLLAVKLALKVATPEDADEALYGLLYNNVSAFSKSYKLMEDIFRVYVYKDGNKTLVRTGPLTGIYASEGQFIKRMIGSSFNEADPEKAHAFFLPYSVAEMVLTIYVPDSHDMSPLNNFVKNYVNDLSFSYPFWNRTKGADHFFVSCHDWGPATGRNHKELRTNAIKVVCNADLTEEFVLGKDASLPEIYLHNLKPPKVGGPASSRRAFLAFFAGQMHGHVRPVLIQHWKGKDPSMKIYEELPRNISRKMSYAQHMKNSKYCICPAGYEVNSPRIVEAIYYDCVPVIIADNFILPFSDVLNWNAFSLRLPESEIPNLQSHLLNIPEKHYRSMQRRLSKVRQHFLWHDQPVKYDVFHMILHSVWMNRIHQLNL